MTSSDTYDSTGVSYYTIPSFTFTNGTTLPDVKVAYRSINPESPSGVVLIPTCYAGLINTTLTFTKAPYDALAGYHVVVVAMLGNGESSSPSNKPLFPLPGELRYADCIRAYHALLTEHLGVTSLEAVVGFSMGGQQSYQFCVMFPDFSKRAVVICGSARTSPHNYAFLEGPVAALTHAIDYIAWAEMKAKMARGETVGVNLKQVRPRHGLRAFGRAYAAWTTSARWYMEGWWGKPKEQGGLGFDSVDAYIAGVMEERFAAWDADDLLALARMWQAGDVTDVVPGRERAAITLPGGWRVRTDQDEDSFRAALADIRAKVLLMPCRTDQYFRPEESETELAHLKHGRLCVIESVWGHVAGGGLNPKDVDFMNARIAEFMHDDNDGGSFDVKELKDTLGRES